MEAQAKNLRCDPANSLVKLANVMTPNAAPPPPPVSYPQLNTPGVSDQFAHSAKTDMASIWTKAIMAALGAGILGRVGLGAFRSIVPKGKTPYGPDTGTQTLDISTEEDEKRAAEKLVHYPGGVIVDMSHPVNRGPTVQRQQLSDKVDAVLSRLPTKETPQSAGGLPGWAKSLAIGAGVPLAGYGLYKLLAPEK